jgi:filamentous hemagglutinin
LKPTLDRIRAGGATAHKNDGSVFRNLPPKGQQRPLLPEKPEGYYTEYVHPTPGVKGPGPQRIVVGKGGEIYYTPDHYDSFIPVN